MRLSRERASAVRSYLLSVYPEIDPDRIVAQGYGPTRPIASNDRQTGRMLNRRVEFVVLNPEATERYTREQLLPSASDPRREEDVRRLLRQILEEELQVLQTAKPDTSQ